MFKIPGLVASFCFAATSASALEYTESEFEGRAILSAIPDEPVGLVYLFHGSGGSANFATRLHTLVIAGRLHDLGYGLVASQSADRDGTASGSNDGQARWNIGDAGIDSNIDIRHLLALREQLIDTTGVTASTPVFVMGMSNGGAFSSLFGYVASANGVPVHAIANIEGGVPPASRPLFQKRTPFPPYFLLSATMDGLVSSTNQQRTAARIKNRGTPVEVHVIEPLPMSVRSLMTPGGLDEKRAKKLHAYLVEAKLINSNGERLYRPGSVITREMMWDLLQRFRESGFSRADMSSVVLVWAGHAMRSDFVDEQIAFFEKYRSNAGGTGPGIVR